MSTKDPKKTLDVLSEAARQWADDGGASLDTRASWAALEELRAASQEGRGKATTPWLSGRRWVLVGGVAALVLVGNFMGRAWLDRPRAVAVVAETISTVDPAVQVGKASARRDLLFSDGSKVAYASASAGEVVATDEHGAHLRLSLGKAHFDVKHQANTSWRVDAGPFAVLVHGTVFDVAWQPANGTFDVALFEGVVTVRGPLPGGEPTLRPGQRLGAVLEQGASQVRSMEVGALGEPPRSSAAIEVPAAAPSAEAATREEAAGTEPAAPTTSVPAGEVSGARRSPRGRGLPSKVAGKAPVVVLPPPATLGSDWGARIARGDYASVLGDAEGVGINVCLSTLSLESLGALVDASRYGRKTDLALRALEAERNRFPGSAAAKEAPFLAGRLTEDNLARPAEAIAWYERYLAENGNGRYAGDALGRLMLAHERLGEKPAARQAARTYLQRHPQGAYVESARRLLHE